MNILLRRLVLTLATSALALTSSALAQLMPQDYWFYNNEGFSVGACKGVAVDREGNIFVGVGSDSATAIRKYSPAGTILKTFGNFSNVVGMAFDSEGYLYVLSGGTVFVFNSAEQQVRSFSTNSSITSSDRHNYLAINRYDEVFICDRAGSKVRVFDKNGTALRSWGSLGTLSGQFNAGPDGIAIAPDQSVWVYNDANPLRLQIFSRDGTFQRSGSNWDFHGGHRKLAITADGMAIMGDGDFRLVDAKPSAVRDYQSSVLFERWGEKGIAVAPNGSDLILLNGRLSGNSTYNDSIRILRRTYHEVDPPLSPHSIPAPAVVSLSQRPGTTLVDIDYMVTDGDSATVQTALLLHVSGSSGNGTIIPATFADNTGNNLGHGIPTNTVHRVTWDAAVDWDTDVGSVSVEVLAKDERGLQPQRWTYDPADPNPDLTPVVRDAASLFWWFVATKDPAVSLVNGQVVGVGGAFNGQVLFNGAATTAGNNFLAQRLSAEMAQP